MKSKMKRDLYIEDLRPDKANLTKTERNSDTAANFIIPKVSHISNILQL